MFSSHSGVPAAERVGATSLSSPMTTRGRQLSQVITALRFPMAVGVVFLHATVVGEIAKQYADDGTWNALHVTTQAVGIFFQIAVPLFFSISGYLFFREMKSWDFNVYKSKLQRRVHTLLIPYIIWNTVAIVCWTQNIFRLGEPLSEYFGGYSLMGVLCHYWADGLFATEQHNVFGGHYLLDYPALIPLWFVRDLMVMTLLTPLFYWATKHLKMWFPLLLTVLYILGLDLGCAGFSTRAFLFFGVGCYLALYRVDFTALASKSLPAILPVTVCLFCLAVCCDGGDSVLSDIPTRLYVLTSCAATVGITARLVAKGRTGLLANLASASFFIYVAHGIPYFGTNRIARMAFLFVCGEPATELWAIALYFLSVLLSVFLCVIAYKLLSRFLPGLTAVLCGGRR